MSRFIALVPALSSSHLAMESSTKTAGLLGRRFGLILKKTDKNALSPRDGKLKGPPKTAGCWVEGFGLKKKL
jgi:hypothetical protein